MADEAKTIDPYADHTPSSGSGLFFGLEDGETARIRIMSDPFIYHAEFKRPDGSVQESNRYGWIIYNHGAELAQVMKMSGTFFSQIAGLSKDPDYGDPKNYDLKITRNGTGTDTKYQVVPAPKPMDIPDDKKLQVKEMDVDDFKETQIMPLKDFLANGSKWPSNTASSPAGDTVVADNPLD